MDHLYIENRSHYFSGNLINILNFKASDLKLDKKTMKDLDIYFINYVDNNTNIHRQHKSVISIN